MIHKPLTWAAWLVTVSVLVFALYKMVRLILIDPPGDPVTLANQLLWLALSVAFAIPGTLVVSNQPRNLIGWLLVIPAVGMSTPGPGPVFLDPNIPPADPSLFLYLFIWFDSWSWVLLIFPILLILLLFPTGQLPTPRWRWVLIWAAASILLLIGLITFAEDLYPLNYDVTWTIDNPIGFIPNAALESDSFSTPYSVSLIGLTITCVSALFVRFRRATGIERTQIKWFLYACFIFGVVYIVTSVNAETSQYRVEMDLLFVLSLITLPAAIGIAILRHRLFDIDIIIRKTLVYSLLSGLLASAFFGVVVSLQGLFTLLLGQQSPVAIILSTLAIAALFSPLRARVQAFIDRGFYRRKYDAEAMLARFTRWMRDETDLDALSTGLLAIVNETIEPETMALWINRRKS